MVPLTMSPSRNARAGGDLELRGELRSLRIERRGRATERYYWSGQPWQLGTAAYWEEETAQAVPPDDYRLGRTLREELGACMLGGFGIESSMALSAFERLRSAGIFDPGGEADEVEIERLLKMPFTGGRATGRYRFPRQKATRIAGALDALAQLPEHLSDLDLRAWLTTIPGVGPKTASWVVRNHRGSDEVAIIDIHVIRAGVAAGVFDPRWNVSVDYWIFEQAFLQWAGHAGVRASFLDACVWAALAYRPDSSRDILGVHALSDTPTPVWPVNA